MPLLYDPMLELQRGHLTLDSSIYDDVAETVACRPSRPLSANRSRLQFHSGCENRAANKRAQAQNAYFVGRPTSHCARSRQS